jgi:hypothetical protein
MTQLDRDWLLKRKKQLKKVVIEDLDLEIYLRKLSVRALKSLADNDSKKDEMEQMVEAILYCCVDENGDEVFTKDSDKDLLMDQGVDVINSIFHEIMQFCHMGNMAIEDKAKN